jgi:hypothetical protein
MKLYEIYYINLKLLLYIKNYIYSILDSLFVIIIFFTLIICSEIDIFES